jgi:hypothetical protein
MRSFIAPPAVSHKHLSLLDQIRGTRKDCLACEPSPSRWGLWPAGLVSRPMFSGYPRGAWGCVSRLSREPKCSPTLQCNRVWRHTYRAPARVPDKFAGAVAARARPAAASRVADLGVSLQERVAALQVARGPVRGAEDASGKGAQRGEPAPLLGGAASKGRAVAIRRTGASRVVCAPHLRLQAKPSEVLGCSVIVVGYSRRADGCCSEPL